MIYLGNEILSWPKGISRAVRILFTSTHQAAFIKDDLRLLRKVHDVVPVLTIGFSSLFQIIPGVARADLTYTWFASVYSALVVFVARLFRKPSIIVIGGVDAAKEPEIGYGIWLSRWKSWFVRYAVLNADKLLVVTPFLGEQLKKLAGYDGWNIVVVPTGYDLSFWTSGDKGKERMVLTVAGCESGERMAMKGIPHLVEAARSFPDVPFLLIGPVDKAAELIQGLNPPANLTVLPFTPREQLLAYYQKSKVYCQPSLFEGLPNSLCEAMLCECIPVGTMAGGIPVAIGEAGFLVDHGDAVALAGAIRRALEAPDTTGRAARIRIAHNFPFSRREERLLEIVGEICH